MNSLIRMKGDVFGANETQLDAKFNTLSHLFLANYLWVLVGLLAM